MHKKLIAIASLLDVLIIEDLACLTGNYYVNADMIEINSCHQLVDLILAHEIIHATGAKHRLQRERMYSSDKTRFDYDREEIVAHYGALMLLNWLDIGKHEYLEETNKHIKIHMALLSEKDENDAKLEAEKSLSYLVHKIKGEQGRKSSMNTHQHIQIRRVVNDFVPVDYWLVIFDKIWDSPCTPGKHDDCLAHGCLDNEPNRIADIDAIITRVTSENYMDLSEDVRNMTTEINTDGCNDDEHDLRPRLFKTKTEAQEHADYTVDKFRNPQPWQVFVRGA